MDLYSVLMVIGIGLASNLDNAGVGIAYGVRRIQISGLANLIIAGISIAATLIGGGLGGLVSLWITPFMAHLIGTIVIVSVGIWVMCQPLLEKKTKKREASNSLVTQILRSPEEADRDQSKTISIGEAVILGIALSMNALAGGFDAGITRLNLVATALTVGVLSYILMALCSYIGSRFAAEKLGDRATILSGLLLIFIGLHQLM